MIIILTIGFVLGIFCSLPVGQIGVLSINRTLKYGFFAGFSVGITVAILDTLACFIMINGISVINQIQSLKFILYGINILLLIFLGWKNVFKKSKNKKMNTDTINSANHNLLKTILIVVVMYFSNIVLFIFWGTIANTINSYSFFTPGLKNSLLLAAGVLIGALSLYFVILRGLHFNRHKIKPDLSSHLTKATGYLFFVFALVLLINLIRSYFY